jgi:hypothetical protein
MTTTYEPALMSYVMKQFEYKIVDTGNDWCVKAGEIETVELKRAASERHRQQGPRILRRVASKASSQW